MSKYTKIGGTEVDYNDPLVEGESIIWKGKPKKGAFIFNSVISMMPIALIWLALDAFIITIFVKNAPTAFLAFIIPFFAIHLFPFWMWLSNVLTAGKRWNNTNYYVTDKRIIVQSGFVNMNYQTVYYKDIKNVNLRVGLIDKMFGVGDITMDLGVYGAGDNATRVGHTFFDIENPQEVYSRIQKIVLDIQTDIEYPNAYRPDENPGYNTKYKG